MALRSARVSFRGTARSRAGLRAQLGQPRGPGLPLPHAAAGARQAEGAALLRASPVHGKAGCERVGSCRAGIGPCRGRRVQNASLPFTHGGHPVSDSFQLQPLRLNLNPGSLVVRE